MRDITFRGMDIHGRWRYGLLTHINTDSAFAPRGFYISNSVGIPCAYSVREQTIGLYTGMWDKNDVRIFEGDILLWEGSYWHIKYSFEGVYRIERWIGERGIDFIDEARSSQVCGNIYETPELLANQK